MDKDIKEAASAFGKMGGKAKFEKYGREHFREMARKGAAARWGKKQESEDQEKQELDKKPE